MSWITRRVRSSGWNGMRWAAAAAFAIKMGITSPVHALPNSSNLAPAGTATANSADFGASVTDGIDGNRDGNFGNGSVFYGNAGPPALYYEVDLGVDAYVDRVQILRRTDADQGVFGNMRLTIFKDDGAGNPGTVAFTHDYVTTSFAVATWGTTDPGGSAPGGALGRHVRLERIDNNYWLTFAEFEVIGSTSPLTFTETDNLARGKAVTTSSPPGYGALITSGNDGDIDADFNRPSRPVFHTTDYGIGQYWQVDLGSTVPLDTVELFARSDGATTSQYKVSVLDASLTPVGSVIVDNAPYNAANPGYDHAVDVSGMTGRYVRVETTREEYLAFSEVRAFAAVPEPSCAVLSAAAALVVVRRRRAC